VIERLKEAWSPEQISGTCVITGGAGSRICHETIYQFVYSASAESSGLFRHLPSHAGSAGCDMPASPRGVTIPLSNTIQKRPAHIGERTTFGHWEGDSWRSQGVREEQPDDTRSSGRAATPS
jgi:IS30 family transposase